MQLPLIVHLDADAFFVSVEQALRPELRGRKVAVGGRERGIISSASYEARACGVYTPMPTSRAVQVCPDLILLSHTSGLYGEYSRRMFEICETLTPVVQRNSIDEGYLDLAPCGFSTVGEVESAVRQLQQSVWDRLQITVSFGIASNQLVSQIASKLRKPRGFVVVPPGDEESFLAPLPVGKLPGIGPKTESVLAAKHGIRLISDLTARPEEELHAIFGTGWREMLATARGIDSRPIEMGRDAAKSYSQQETFSHDIRDFAAIEQIAKRMIDELMPAVRADAKRVRTMTVKIRYPDFSQESRARSLEAASDLEAPFYPLVEPLLRAAWRKPRPLRLVSVRFSGVDDGAAQLEIFGQADERRRRLAGVLDRLNDGKGSAVVRHGHQLGGRNSGQADRGP